jgi:hypothetical protein
MKSQFGGQMNKDELIESLPKELPMRMASRREFAILAHALDTTPLARYLVMSNGTRVGWKSNKHCYVSQEALDVAKKRLGILR